MNTDWIAHATKLERKLQDKERQVLRLEAQLRTERQRVNFMLGIWGISIALLWLAEALK